MSNEEDTRLADHHDLEEAPLSKMGQFIAYVVMVLLVGAERLGELCCALDGLERTRRPTSTWMVIGLTANFGYAEAFQQPG